MNSIVNEYSFVLNVKINHFLPTNFKQLKSCKNNKIECWVLQACANTTSKHNKQLNEA